MLRTVAAAGSCLALTMLPGLAPAGGSWAAERPHASLPLQSSRDDKIHGMTLSTPRGSAEWGKDHIVPAIDDLRRLGVNWITIHPYARIELDGTVRWRGHEAAGVEPPRWLRRPIEEAHRQGVKIMVKPHLAPWGNYSWRGEIEYSTAEQWERFFDTYGEWISAVAHFSRDADAFAVGTELDRTVAHETEWRRIVAAVREQYPGPLTYAANWTDYDRVPFWDALDAIGIQAYFPVIERTQAPSGELPSPETLAAGWERIMAPLRRFGARHGKTIVFTELGYTDSWLAATQPWDYSAQDAGAEALQRLCMDAALTAIANEPAVVGAFLWKWFPGDRTPRDFAMSSAVMREVIALHWRALPEAR